MFLFPPPFILIGLEGKKSDNHWRFFAVNKLRSYLSCSIEPDIKYRSESSDQHICRAAAGPASWNTARVAVTALLLGTQGAPCWTALCE